MHIFGARSSDCFRDVAFRIVNIAEKARFGATYFYAGGFFADSLQMLTECAFFDHVRVGIVGTCAVWARCHTHLAANALFLVDENLTVIGTIGGSGWTNFHAGSVLAALAD